MWFYLQAAFFHRVSIPGLGAIPINLLVVLAFFILGLGELIKFGHAGFWLLGLGLETAYLYFLASSPVFQSLAKASREDAEFASQQESAEARRQQLIQRLTPENRARFQGVAAQAAKVTQLERANNTKEYLVKTNWEALQKLLWMYLKLLTAWQNLQDPGHQAKEQQVREQIAKIQAALEEPNQPEDVRESHQATLEMLQKRLDHFTNRKSFLAKLVSDMTRVETQVDIAVDNAAMSGHNQVLSDEIEMVGSFLQEMQDEFYGDSQSTIADLDRLYS